MPSKPPVIIGKPRLLSRWGNSPAVHLSREVLAAAGVEESQAFTLQAARGRILLVFETAKTTPSTHHRSQASSQDPA